MTDALTILGQQIAGAQFGQFDRQQQKETLEGWIAAAIADFNIDAPEQWRLICIGQAIAAIYRGMYGLALQQVQSATLSDDDISPAFLDGVSDMERDAYALGRLPQHLQFVRDLPYEPHPIFGFIKAKP